MATALSGHVSREYQHAHAESWAWHLTTTFVGCATSIAENESRALPTCSLSTRVSFKGRRRFWIDRADVAASARGIGRGCHIRRETAIVAPGAEGEIGHLVFHGRRAKPHRFVRPQALAKQTRRQTA